MSSSSSSDEDDRRRATFFRAISTAAVLWWERVPRQPLTRAARANRDRIAAQALLEGHYFNLEQTYDKKAFKRRFRMRRELFLRIKNDLEAEFPWFQQGVDARGRIGFTALQKCTAAIRHMGYGRATDSFDEYLQMSDRTIRSCVFKFSKAIITLYHKQYLRKPSASDIQQIYAHHSQKHGFPGMLGSIDCTHWEWILCPTAWRGQFSRGDHPRPTMSLEAVASNDLWFWHAFFGVPGSNNDINVLDQSPLFDDMVNGNAPDSSFELRDIIYKRGYYLSDGIYPDYACIVKSISHPEGVRRQTFKKAHEAARKDVERAFGGLKNKWHIIANPSRIWHQKRMRHIMYACVILHNMTLEDAGRAICQYDPNEESPPYVVLEPQQQTQNLLEIHNRTIHHQLQADLIEHIYERSLQED